MFMWKMHPFEFVGVEDVGKNEDTLHNTRITANFQAIFSHYYILTADFCIISSHIL